MLPEIKKIVLTLDMSEHSVNNLKYAVSQAQKYQADIFVIHVVEPITTFAKAMIETYVKKNYPDFEKKEKELILKKVKKEIEEFCEKELGNSSALNCIKAVEIREGLPYEEILNYAKEIGADLIVVGHGKGYAKHLLGSVARKLVNLSDIPILVVK